MGSWSLEDKTKLLALLREYGTDNLKLIQQKLPKKTLAEIQYLCKKYSDLALKKWHKKEKKDDPTIKNWILIMKRIKHSQKDPVQNIIPRLLKYIALFEKREDSNDLNLSNCYQILSDITNGEPLILGDEIHDYFLNDCLAKLAKSIKSGEIRSFTTHLMSLRTMRDFYIHGQQNNSKIACSEILNPLAVPDNLLKMSEAEKISNGL